ncbi:MAG: hypothetical protein KBF62_03460 [Candidatus Pacebacteria bacterium]|jgi:uncharacterized integral membrane protein|nr:hypothetical protein [Candidatus Moranbacteria bacterium]MBP9058664.1 hypothetical protein [Candidatus Paceibacterota bacterium]MBP9801614.1 hypothetical protein [Candidatus Moranbacteria bacterium]
MKMLVALVLAGMALTFFVVTNIVMVPLHFYSYTVKIPLPFILIFPTGIALLCFAFYHEHRMKKSTIVIRELENDLQSEQEKGIEIVRRTHELELENQKLKIRLGDVDKDDDSI